MTETQAEKEGFDFVKSYHHDQFYTRRFEKGVIALEFTYESESDKVVSTDINMFEVSCLEVNLDELKSLDAILNKKQ